MWNIYNGLVNKKISFDRREQRLPKVVMLQLLPSADNIYVIIILHVFAFRLIRLFLDKFQTHYYTLHHICTT